MLIKRNTRLWSNKEDAFQYIHEKSIATPYSYESEMSVLPYQNETYKT